MNKIIQISTTEEDVFCLTEDGKVYIRSNKVEETGVQNNNGTIEYKRTYFWLEILEEEERIFWKKF